MGLQDSSIRVWWRGGGGTHMVVSGMFLTRGMLVIRSWKLERIHIVTLVSVLCMTTWEGGLVPCSGIQMACFPLDSAIKDYVHGP